MRSTAAGTGAVPALEPASAMRSFGSHVRFWTAAVLGLALDLWSKEWAFRTLRQGGQRTLIPGVLEFQTTLNAGALFGIGKGHTEVFLIASLLALLLVLWMFAQSSPRRPLMHVALGAILAGALGNMYDRIFVQLVEYDVAGAGGRVRRCYVLASDPQGERVLLREYPPDALAESRFVPRAVAARLDRVGHVRDFIKIPTRWLGGRDLWPWVFNVADMLLVGGVGVLAVRLLRDREPRPRAAGARLDAGAGPT